MEKWKCVVNSQKIVIIKSALLCNIVQTKIVLFTVGRISMSSNTQRLESGPYMNKRLIMIFLSLHCQEAYKPIWLH